MNAIVRESLCVDNLSKILCDGECTVLKEWTSAGEPLQRTCEAQDCVAGELESSASEVRGLLDIVRGRAV